MNPLVVFLFTWGFFLGRRTKSNFFVQLLAVILGMILGSAAA